MTRSQHEIPVPDDLDDFSPFMLQEIEFRGVPHNMQLSGGDNIHPLALTSNTIGHREKMLNFPDDAYSLPGMYASLLVIRKYQESIRKGHGKVCIIPKSAHGTKPASAAMCGMMVKGGMMISRVCRSRNSDRRTKMWKHRTGCSEVVQQLFRVEWLA